MKSIITITLILFCFSTVLSQVKMNNDCDLKKEIKKLEKEIFLFPGDKKIDTTANYKLLYTQTGGWSEVVGSKKFKRFTYSKGNRVNQFVYSKGTTNEIFSGEKIYKEFISLGNDEVLRKVKKKRFKDTDFGVIFSFGEKFLIQVLPVRYVGSQTSQGGVTYLYYEKLNN